eukprot:3171070-Rhodomonas_salina.3
MLAKFAKPLETALRLDRALFKYTRAESGEGSLSLPSPALIEALLNATRLALVADETADSNTANVCGTQ